MINKNAKNYFVLAAVMFFVFIIALSPIVPNVQEFIIAAVIIVIVPLVLYWIARSMREVGDIGEYQESSFIMNNMSYDDREKYTEYNERGFAVWKPGYSERWYIRFRNLG